MLNDSNVRIPDDQLQDVVKIIAEGGNGMDIHRAKIRNSNGVPVSERQAQRYAAKARQIILDLDSQVLSQIVGAERYMPGFQIEEADSDYLPVIVPRVNNRSCIFDIETNAPSFGRMNTHTHFLICASFYPLDGEAPYTLALDFDEQREDKWLLYDVLNELAKYTFVIGHNVKGYDINWLMTRVMGKGWRIPNRLFYYDTYQAARRIPLLTKKSLGSLMEFFNYRGATKTSVDPQTWDMISSPKIKDFEYAMSRVVHHCEQDVIGNRYIYDVMMQYDPQPRWGLWPLNG